LLRRYKLIRNTTIVAAALFLVSMLPIFGGLVVFGLQTRFILWKGTLVTWIIRREVEKRT
jgi:intracellular septation protein A